MNDALVVICGGADQAAVPRLNEWADRTVAYIGVDRGCLSLLEAGYPVDYAVGDFDSVSELEFQQISDQAGQVIRHPSHKDDTDMELALELAVDHYPSASFYIIGGLGQRLNRLDHLVSNLMMVHQTRFIDYAQQLHFIEQNLWLRFYAPGSHMLEAFVDNDYLSIVALTPVSDLSISGAKYELARQDFTYPLALISNEFVGQRPVSLSFSQGLVMVLWVQEN